MSDTVAEAFRGLAQADLAKMKMAFAWDDFHDPFVAAYPTFRRFNLPGTTTYRDEVVLLRGSISTVPKPRLSVAVPPPDARAAWELNELPATFRAGNGN